MSNMTALSPFGRRALFIIRLMVEAYQPPLTINYYGDLRSKVPVISDDIVRYNTDIKTFL